MAKPKEKTTAQVEVIHREVAERPEASILLADQAVEVELAGRKYTWKERGRRDKRLLLIDMAPVVRAARDKEKQERVIESVNMALDFFYKHNEAMAKDREYLDDNAEGMEVAEAFRIIREWADPPLPEEKRKKGKPGE